MRDYFKSGDPFIWLTGGAVAFALLMVAGLVFLIMVNGLGFFWPEDVARLSLADGRTVTGQIAEREEFGPVGATKWRVKVKQANRDLHGQDFIWIDEADIRASAKPADAVVLERREWGDFIGEIKEVKEGGALAGSGPAAGYDALVKLLPAARETFDYVRRMEQKDIGELNYAQERIRLKLKKMETAGKPDVPESAKLREESQRLNDSYSALMARIDAIKSKQTASVTVSAGEGMEKEIPLALIVRVTRPNSMGVFGKTGVYLSKIWEFVADDPRESNTEGGVFPAIFGTVLMVMIMSVAVAPFGVLAAFYLREYARQGTFVSAVRIAVNNLAGVPSIVFGVFGVGFFIYFIGGTVDRVFFSESLPTPTFGTGGILWASLTLALLTVPVVIVATEEGLAAIPKGLREASLALGATKFETTWRVVLPAALPSILTGLILAMARAAGEVAPLMITGVVKLAPSLPIDGFWPFMHMERKFMHLGFHIYDVGFQSPNVDAARPMVYTTTLLLLLIVLALNIGAIMTRNRLKKKFATSAV
ncbi:MAG: phosphate ABC transporter permease PstA [Nitrospinae bacterium]|nr:phosphate ABC transporter permease PstA [Nitrospinota bacterium]